MANIIKPLNIKKLFMYAIRKPILIITETNEQAALIMDDLRAYCREYYPQLMSRHYFKDIIYINGYEKIMVIPLEKWAAENRIDFKGHVYTLSDEIPENIPHIIEQPMTLREAFLPKLEDIR